MAAEGTVLISGSQWLQGKGVAVYSNGGNFNTRYQCVELPQARLYPTMGWPRVYAAGNGGAQYIPEGSPGLTRYNPGSKYIPVPGDLVIEYGNSWNAYGHVSVVDYTDTEKGVIYAVEQNASANGRVTYAYNGSNYTGLSATRSVKCILHAPGNSFKNPSVKPPQGDYIAYGKYVTITKKGYSLWSSFNWGKKDTTDNLFNETYLAKGYYSHSNGSRYYSLYDEANVWKGYLNAEAVVVAKELIFDEVQEYKMLHKDQTFTIDTLPWGTKGYKKLANSKDYMGKVVHLTQKAGAYYYSPDLKGWIDYKALDTVEKINQALTIKNGGYQINPVPWYQGVASLGNTKDHIGKKVSATGKKGGYYYIPSLGWIDHRAF
ncbi:CHAP domain-containing protein [Candidatus Enterococcus ikei]|uniref:SH3-like domain-containing protein n=1 Tax=Candidatus Enterococcus ikei TaxID=2815326 RepID=A0ABS3GX30_9ENTE|nr:CHAP domain-containing protein [Enterococcus sp. DIV0869a]MBO0439029.1 SH3-like domain-containing protein [Enterococcus sp. DIV0869a]